MVDLVIPYVDNTDPNWIRTYANTCRIAKVKFNPDGPRFKTDNRFKEVMDGIKKNMPFLRKIHLVVSQDSQVPKWVDRNEINVVLHEDIIPKKYLPTFNSCTIEMFIKNIPDLAEKFIYTNDDIFAVNPMTEDDFFDSDGNCRMFFHKIAYAKHNIYWHQCRNGMKLVKKKWDVTDNQIFKPDHVMHPILKSACEKVWQEYETQILKSLTKFRERENFNQYIYMYWQYVNKYKCVEKVLDRSKPYYVYLNSKASPDKFKENKRKPYVKMICVNS